MANALTVGGSVINITFDGSANDLNFATYFPNGTRIAGIDFIASAGTDVFILKIDSATGKTFCKLVGTRYLTWTECLYVRSLYLDISDCTIGTPAGCLAIIYLVT